MSTFLGLQFSELLIVSELVWEHPNVSIVHPTLGSPPTVGHSEVGYCVKQDSDLSRRIPIHQKKTDLVYHYDSAY